MPKGKTGTSNAGEVWKNSNFRPMSAGFEIATGRESTIMTPEYVCSTNRRPPFIAVDGHAEAPRFSA